MISLRQMTKRDIDFVISCLDDTNEDFMNMWGGGRWYSYPVTREQILAQFQARVENTRYFIICNDGCEIGSVELDFIDWENKKCSVCRFLIAGEHRSKGYGAETLRLLALYAFDDLGIETVNLSVYDFNLQAIRCYEKAGFKEYSRSERPNGWIAVQMSKTRLGAQNK